MIPLIVIGAIGLVGWVIYAVYRAEQKRKDALRTACQMMGFAWEDEAPVHMLGDFPLFGEGRRKDDIQNVSRGELGGRPATIGEYSYVISSGKSSHTVRQTVVVFTDAQAVPDFTLAPENVFHKLAGAFGYQDIDFEQHEEFSKRYLLRGQDEEAIRRIFTPDALMLLGSQPGWTVQARNGRLLVFRSGKTTKAAELPVFAAEALRIAGGLSPRGSS